MTVQTFDQAEYDKWLVAAEARPDRFHCLICMNQSMEVNLTRKDGHSATCRKCDIQGFMGRVDFVYSLFGCGAFLGRLTAERRAKLYHNLMRLGADLVRADQWTTGLYGTKKGPIERKLLRTNLFCPLCPSRKLTALRDVHDKPYVTDRGCGSRFFLPSDEALVRIAGWSVFRSRQAVDPWIGWHREGRAIWAARVGMEFNDEDTASSAASERKAEEK